MNVTQGANCGKAASGFRGQFTLDELGALRAGVQLVGHGVQLPHAAVCVLPVGVVEAGQVLLHHGTPTAPESMTSWLSRFWKFSARQTRRLSLTCYHS